MAYTLGQAAKAVGRTKPTILAALENGRISGSRNAKNHWQIEPAELHRIYPPLTVRETEGFNDSEPSNLTPPNTALIVENKGLEKLVEFLENERDDLRRRLDEETEERRKLTLMLTDQRRKSWFDRLFARSRS